MIREIILKQETILLYLHFCSSFPWVRFSNKQKKNKSPEAICSGTNGCPTRSGGGLYKTAHEVIFQINLARNFHCFSLRLVFEFPLCFSSSLLFSQTHVIILAPVLAPNLQFIRTNYVRQLSLFSQDRMMGLGSRREAAEVMSGQ